MRDATMAEKFIFHLVRFMSFFLVMSLVVTVNFLLFLRDVPMDEALVRKNAVRTFVNMLLLTVLFCCVDERRRRVSVDRPLNRILDALDRITRGDYSVRLDAEHRDFSRTGFRSICLEINKLAKELSGVETLRTDFIANVSHELKTPLAAVRNYATLLRDEGLSPGKRQEYVDAIARTSSRLAELVSNILKLNKLENQQIFPEKQVFDLGEQLCQCLLAFEAAWEKKELELECEIAEDVQVEADPELLSLVWNNLISNAVKFTPNGGKLTIRLTVDERWVSVVVADTGCGMSAETGRHIFEKFYQGDTAHATEGNGLGLALVKRVVDITGGVISVSSAPGRGSAFTVRLEQARE